MGGGGSRDWITTGTTMHRFIQVLSMALLLANPAAGAERFWTNSAGGIFSDDGNWSGPAPGESDAAIFNLRGIYTVSFADSALCNRLLFRSGAIALNLSSHSLTATHSLITKPSIAIGELAGNSAAVTVDGGTMTGAIIDLGVHPLSSGSLVLADKEASVVSTMQLRIGVQGEGAITLSNGATLLSNTAMVAALSGSEGSISLDGNGTTWTCTGDLSVGKKGPGTLAMTDRAALESGEAIIGQNRGSLGVATLNDAEWIIDGSLDVGFDDVGSLVLRNESTVEVGEFLSVGTLGPTPFDPPGTVAGDGFVEVTDESTLTVAGSVYLPLSSVGNMLVGDEGRVIIGGDFIVSRSFTTPETTIAIDLTAQDSGGEPIISVAGEAAFPVPSAVYMIVELKGNYKPVPGASFTLLQASEMSGSPILVLPNLLPPVSWSQAITGTGIVVTVLPGSADLNGDSLVDGADLGLLLGSWGVDSDTADLNGDQIVNGADLGILLGGWS